MRFLLFEVSMVDRPQEEGYFIQPVKKKCFACRIVLKLLI